MKKIFRIYWLGCATLLLAACGGGGGGDNDNTSLASGRYLSGVAEDGPLAGARIELIDPSTGEVLRACGASGRGRCETLTATDGTFTLHIRTDLSVDSLAIAASGGFDRDVGKLSVVLRAPMNLFAGREDQVVISPVTSVLAAVVQSGESLALASEQVRHWLALDPALDLGCSPSANAEMREKTLLVTSVALALGGEKPFLAIAEKMSTPLIDAEISPPTLNVSFLAGLGLSAERVAEIQDAFKIIASQPKSLQKEFLRYELQTAADRLLLSTAGFSAQNADYLSNLDLLTEQIMVALGSSPLPFLGERIAAKRIVRYVLYTYGLTSAESFQFGPEDFLARLRQPGSGILLRSDPLVAELASLETAYSVVVPLATDEIPGNDNQRRSDYFYRSDLSPFYLAEKINNAILDDQYSDRVMLEIGIGKAKAGLLEEGRAIIGTQIFQTELIGDGYRQLAEVLLDYNRVSEAVDALQKAETRFKQVIQSKGVTSITITDTNRLQLVGTSYRRAGDIARSLAIFDYLGEIAQDLDSASLYGSAIVGTWQVADQYMEEGRNDLAAPLVDFMYALALSTPPNVTSGKYFSKAKIFYLVETAKRYATLGNLAQVNAIYHLVQTIRVDDGYENLTADETWVYMVDFVELLYQVGESGQASELAKQMPAAYALKAYKLVATYEAVQNGLPAALAIIDAQIPLAADRIEALTYFATNKSREYVALAFIERNQLVMARQALDHALTLIDSLAPGTDADRYQQLIQLGYVKVSELYALAGDPLTAEALLRGKAEPALAVIGGLKYRIDSLSAIATGYQILGQSARSEALLAQAKEEIDVAVAATVPPVNPGARSKLYSDFASLYEGVIKVYEGREAHPAFLPAADSYAAVVRQIFDPTASYSGNEHDSYAGKEVDKLLKAAEYRRLAGDVDGALPLLAEAEATADVILVESTRVGKRIAAAAGYAATGQFDAALAVAKSFAADNDRYKALQAVALVYAARDDLPYTDVAHIDSDHDGRPDFFNPLAGADEIVDSGLLLDDDSDGDGILDLEDSRPLVSDRPAP